MSHQRSASNSHPPTRTPPISRPTTPLRPSSRSSLRNSHSKPFDGPSALDALESQFSELADSMADLEANFMHLQLMNESLSRFGESFAAFLYGLNMNAFVVDFPEAPAFESIKRWQKMQRQKDGLDASTLVAGPRGDGETVLSQGDTTTASMKATPRRKSVAPPTTPGTNLTSSTRQLGMTPARGGAAGRGARGGARGARGSGLPRGRGRGVR